MYNVTVFCRVQDISLT